MPQKERRLSPDNILYVWEAVRATKQVPANGTKVLKCMTDLEYKPEEAEEVLSDALQDGVLLAVPATGGKSGNWKRKSLEGKAFKLPELEDLEVDKDSHDWYCYECHKPGELQNCSDCPRAFHLMCRRSIPEKLNEYMNLSYKQRRIEPALTETITGQANREPDQPDPLDQSELPEPEAENNTAANSEIPAELDDNIENAVSEQKPTLKEITVEMDTPKIGMIPNLKNEADVKPAETKADIIYLGEVRPPSKRRRAKSVHYKSERDETDEDDTCNLCTRCKLLKMSSIRDPPNMKSSEVNFLLRFTFERIKSWINTDTFSPLSFSNSMHLPSKKEWEVLLKLAFKCPVTHEAIDDKITKEKYTSLTEFQCDMMDIQHCIAILYGTGSTEFEATKYLISDCSFELTEIRQCRDCYRHSNEKSTPLWFCKPCVPRHELVFAKQTGYCFWPAKVIKVKDNQYDVRFFGASHSRAIVDAHNVRPIDTDETLLKVRKSQGYQKAVEELRKHQEFLQLPPGTYSYEAERNRPQPITILATGISTSSLQGISEFIQRRSGTRTPKLSGSARKGTPKTPQTPMKARLSPMQTRNSPVLTIEVASSRDKSLGLGKRKRKAVIRENYVSGDDAESSSSDFASGKKGRSNSSERLQKKKGKRGRKFTADRLYYAPPHALKKIVTPEQALALTPTPSRDDHISSQDSAVSSTQEITPQPKARPGRPKSRVSKAGKTYSAAVENLRRELDTITDIAVLKKTALESFQTEVDRLQKAVNHMMEGQNKTISEIKKRQWCYHCEKEAIYYCCWNTAYCSTSCQQEHWQREHKKACRRTR